MFYFNLNQNFPCSRFLSTVTTIVKILYLERIVSSISELNMLIKSIRPEIRATRKDFFCLSKQKSPMEPLAENNYEFFSSTSRPEDPAKARRKICREKTFNRKVKKKYFNFHRQNFYFLILTVEVNTDD